jgi:serine/threonine-protein kinase HipA
MADGKTLIVYMNGERAATWSVRRATHELAYEPEWVRATRGRPLSLSLPFLPGNQVHRGDAVRSFFENLLPDRPEVRNRLRDRFHTESAAAFDLLAEIGRDCVGAIQLLPPTNEPPTVRKIEGVPLSSDEITRHLEVVRGLRLPGFDPDDFRISLAGAQEKTAFLWHREAWHKPIGATPSTHIVKLPLGGIGGLGSTGAGSIENEWLCSKILAAFGLPAVETQMARFGTMQVLIVERFDRRLSDDGDWWVRLPTEDFCQVKGMPPEKKYEADGGPGIDDVLKVLAGSVSPAEERARFLKTQIVFWLLAAPDGHAKNFSIFLGPRGAYRMTPLYDVLSVYPWMGDGVDRISVQNLKMAMAIRGKNPHYRWNTIRRRHWEETARRNGLSGILDTLIPEVIDHTSQVVESVRSDLPPDFPEEIAGSIFAGMDRAAARLAADATTK